MSNPQTTEQAKHTPTPWIVAVYGKKRFGLGRPSGGAFFLIQCVHDDTESPAALADAHFIQTAVNAHDELLAACKAALAELSPRGCSLNDFGAELQRRDNVIEIVRSALSRASATAKGTT